MVLKGSTGVSAHRLQQMRSSAAEAEKNRKCWLQARGSRASMSGRTWKQEAEVVWSERRSGSAE